jgi:3-deoxy-D-manno-octulosonic-acid transferase
MGELFSFYGASSVAFVAGSLRPELGGHNLLEPAAWAKPVVTGPNVKNFLAISQWLDEAGGLSIVENSDQLAKQIIRFFSDDELAQRVGRSAQSVIAEHRGALEKIITAIHNS